MGTAFHRHIVSIIELIIRALPHPPRQTKSKPMKGLPNCGRADFGGAKSVVLLGLTARRQVRVDTRCPLEVGFRLVGFAFFFIGQGAFAVGRRVVWTEADGLVEVGNCALAIAQITTRKAG
jgi:hypothetical protein